MSFDEIHSNIVSQQDNQQLTSDPIATFTDEENPFFQEEERDEGFLNPYYSDTNNNNDIGDDGADEIIAGSSELYSQNILDGLDDWRPTPGFKPSSSPYNVNDDEDDDDILSSFVTDDDLLASQQRPQKVSSTVDNITPARIEGAPIPDFRFQSSPLPRVYPKLPPVTTNNHHHQHQRNPQLDTEKPPEPLVFKEHGPAKPIIRQIAQAAEDHAAWESKVRAEMAKLGSLPKVCSLFDNATLFRILESWTERGLIFGRCVQVRPNELTYMQQQESMYNSKSHDSNNNNNDDDDMIEDLISQRSSLPPYIPMAGEQVFTFLFSFAYMPQTTVSIKNQFLQEECVAIWTPWTVVSEDIEREICVITRFLSYSLY
ncbi:hypothetical protein BDC45DRAFT_604146 [Circinella umbellata]|nr:hypothetical protein BDC45DRAFT_604146 [Circinella umbellata]